MRVDLECGCGAKLTVAYDDNVSRSYLAHEKQQAEKLIEQFRRDHKACREKK